MNINMCTNCLAGGFMCIYQCSPTRPFTIRVTEWQGPSIRSGALSSSRSPFLSAEQGQCLITVLTCYGERFHLYDWCVRNLKTFKQSTQRIVRGQCWCCLHLSEDSITIFFTINNKEPIHQGLIEDIRWLIN